MVEEGGEAQMLHVITTFPPGFFCHNLSAWDDCYITVTTSIATAKELSCQEEALVQAVIGYDQEESGPPCGKRITNSNWKTGVMITVKAKVDSPFRDGDQHRKLNVHVTVWTGDTSITNNTLDQIKVCSDGTQ